MKTIYAMIFLGLFSLGIQNAGAHMPVRVSAYDIPENTYPSLTQQIARLIPFPEILEEGGIVAISFQVNKNSRISKVKVYTENEELNQHIISHLEGKKLHRYEFEGKEQFRLRIHFAASRILAVGYGL